MSDARTAEQYEDYSQQTDAARFGMWVFLATEILFFGVILFVYGMTRARFPEDFAAASRHTDVVLGTLNTALLLTSSFTMAVAVRFSELKQFNAARLCLYSTAMLGVAFLAVKGFEYHQDFVEQLVPRINFEFDPAHARGAEAFFGLYFATTAIHALHLLIGICAVLLLSRRAAPRRTALQVEVVGLYWHFVDVVWIFLYPLLYLVSRA